MAKNNLELLGLKALEIELRKLTSSISKLHCNIQALGRSIDLLDRILMLQENKEVPKK